MHKEEFSKPIVARENNDWGIYKFHRVIKIAELEISPMDVFLV